MNKAIFVLAFLIGGVVFGQHKMNNYKYVIVPKKFDEFKKENQYRTNALVKFLFQKKGFTTVYDDDLPEDLKKNRCLGLKVDLLNKSNMFTTKTALELKNCDEEVVFTTKVGVSKSKEFEPAYHETIRESFESFNNFKYVYNGKDKKNSDIVVVNFKDDVKQVSDIEKQSQLEKIVEKEKETPAQTPVVQKTDSSTLYAQEITNGFQLVDSTPKILFKIYKTSIQGYYIAEQESANGVVINKNGNWVFEYYENGQLISRELKIKF